MRAVTQNANYLRQPDMLSQTWSNSQARQWTFHFLLQQCSPQTQQGVMRYRRHRVAEVPCTEKRACWLENHFAAPRCWPGTEVPRRIQTSYVLRQSQPLRIRSAISRNPAVLDIYRNRYLVFVFLPIELFFFKEALIKLNLMKQNYCCSLFCKSSS